MYLYCVDSVRCNMRNIQSFEYKSQPQFQEVQLSCMVHPVYLTKEQKAIECLPE